MDINPLNSLKSRWPDDQSIFSSTLGRLRSVAENLRINEEDSRAIAHFAELNNFTYSQRPLDPPIGTKDYAPAWLRIPTLLNEPAFIHEIKGRINSYPVTICMEYVPASTGQPESMIQNLAKRSIIRIQLPKIFPQIVLDSNKNDQGPTSSIPNSIKHEQTVKLEGDFAAYFDLFVPVGLQLDALTVLAPNFMELLKGSSAHFDVEFYGSEVTFITRESIYSPEIMEQALQILHAELGYLTHLLLSWNYQPVRLPFDTLTYTTWNGEVVKLGRLRLRPGAFLVLILIGFVVFGIMIALLNKSAH